MNDKEYAKNDLFDNLFSFVIELPLFYLFVAMTTRCCFTNSIGLYFMLVITFVLLTLVVYNLAGIIENIYIIKKTSN